MPGLRKHEPVPESAMEVKSPVNSICEVLREIYHATDNELVRLKAREATAMAKAMDKKLVEYTKDRNWYEGFWDDK